MVQVPTDRPVKEGRMDGRGIERSARRENDQESEEKEIEEEREWFDTLSRCSAFAAESGRWPSLDGGEPTLVHFCIDQRKRYAAATVMDTLGWKYEVLCAMRFDWGMELSLIHI